MTAPKPRFHVDASIARAWTLPSYLYVDPLVHEEENTRLFAHTWQVVGHRGQAANPGDYFTTELSGEPLLLVRGHDAQLRGFYNICRHRGGPPATGCGSRKLFRCGYHGWTYGLDGSLSGATEFEEVEGFDPANFALTPVPAEEWFNLVFVNLDPEARPLRESLGLIPDHVRKYPFTGMKLFERRTYDMQCNWKTYVDNYLEGYHLPSVHPGLNRELDYSAYTVEPSARHVRQFSPIRGLQSGETKGRRYPQSSDPQTADYFWIFPNWMLNCYPDNISLNIVRPLAAERSAVIFEWYVRQSDYDAGEARAAVEFSHQIQMEDVEICEIVQRNLRSRSYSRGRFSVKQEKGVHAFHRMYAEFMQ